MNTFDRSPHTPPLLKYQDHLKGLRRARFRNFKVVSRQGVRGVSCGHSD
jgi:hypothetical protein